MRHQVEPRPAIAADLDAVMALERATENAPHWPSTAYNTILVESANSPERCLFVAYIADRLAGFAVALIRPIVDGVVRTAELESVAVATFARRTGVGRALCHTVFDWCRARGATEIMLEVRATSLDANCLYDSLGFNLVARRPRYYRSPDDDALLRRLPL